MKKSDMPLDRLPGTILNTHLLEIFQNRADRLEPAELLRNYRQNRFVKPADLDGIALCEFLLSLRQWGRTAGFENLELSPVAPFGACSAVAAVSQNNVLTALRGTEVVADATNVLALESSVRRIAGKKSNEVIHFCTVHRHLRAQVFKFKGFTPHFSVFCLTSAGRDTGNFRFEKENLLRHLRVHHSFLTEKMHLKDIKIHLIKYLSEGRENRVFGAAFEYLRENEPTWHFDVKEIVLMEGRGYYPELQFKIFAHGKDGREWDVADGGFVDWTARLAEDRKERFIISGLGAELLFRFLGSGLTSAE